jgi:transcriptional regulator with XRE-family HTH domain
MSNIQPADEGTVGNLIRRLRIAAGLSQEQLAEACGEQTKGISQTSISRWERNGNPGPSWEQLRAVIAVSGGKADDFAGGLSMLTGVSLAARDGGAPIAMGA